MGVPAFYRWLSTKYPLIVNDVVEDEPYDEDGNEVPIDTSLPNPNGTECVCVASPPAVIKAPPYKSLDSPVQQQKATRVLSGGSTTQNIFLGASRPR